MFFLTILCLVADDDDDDEEGEDEDGVDEVGLDYLTKENLDVSVINLLDHI